MSGADKAAPDNRAAESRATVGRATVGRATAGRATAGRATVRVSVRAVVEATLHESDLCVGQDAMRRMREGTLAHRARQAQGERQERDYRSETALAADYEGETVRLHVAGRADALLTRADGVTIVEEIKLGEADTPLSPAHRAQAAMYGHMLCVREGLAGVCLRVLYVNARGERAAQYEEDMPAPALAAEFDALCAPVAAWEGKRLARRAARDDTLGALAFPFAEYRAGQRRFAANVFVALRERKRLFAQAPTGIGKTMAALYPALRAMGEGYCARTVFLTARTTGRASALSAMRQLLEAGASVMTVEIAAKDKVCPRPVRDCRPERCPLAEGFYDRLPAALKEALAPGLWDRAATAALAQAHGICPFELSLELAMLADVVVCDYNYVFDPMVAMDRLMEGGAALLADEAHQLAPRVRDAYSAVLDMDALIVLRRETGRALGRRGALYRALTGAIRALREAARAEDFETLTQPPETLARAMTRVREAAGEALSQGGGSGAMDAFALAQAYLLAAGRFDERYALLCGGGEKHARVELALLCADREILEATKRAHGTVYFSATLAPFDAARRMLGSEEGDACLLLPSPFDPAQLDARIAPIDIRYASREQTAPQVAAEIARQLARHAGHTIVFFPSYAYLARIAALLEEAELPLLRERRGMTEDEKSALLGAFEPGAQRAVLLAVLGGAFSEGIDLPGDRLRSVIVVSTGMPQPDARLRAMQAYYDGIGEDGFFLCMTLPGMIHVIQAAGRLIRTDADTGALLLIDSRYRAPRTRSLLAGTLIGDALGIS
ncbi:MAG: helicase C-terminal domain-containing protein [Candidatus Ventricola sp.]